MLKQNTHHAGNSKVTIDQIGRLEHGLLTMRETALGSPDVLDMIALIQYQEILRLRSELDANLGFDTEETCDLVMALQGPEVGLGTVPSNVIASILTNIRTALQSVSWYLATNQPAPPGRFDSWVYRATDFQLGGVSSGSVQIRLNLPGTESVSDKYERESVERGLRLILDTVRWVSSDAQVNAFQHLIEDEYLAQLLLLQVERMTPTRYGVVQRVSFSGNLVDAEHEYTLSYSSADKIKHALREVSNIKVIEEGKFRSVDIDKGTFILRQRPNGKPDLFCVIPSVRRDMILRQVVNYLAGETPVHVEGVQNFDKRGRPSRLIVESIHELPLI